MAKAPSLQFYPGDWQRDTAIRMCSLAARGLWIELMWLMFDGQPYGHLSVKGSVIPDSKISVILGVDAEECASLLKELEAFGVFSRTDDGTIYSRRMVNDRRRRETNILNGQRGGNPRLSQSDNPKVKAQVIPLRADADAVPLTQEKKEHASATSRLPVPKVHEPTLWPSFDDWWDLYGKKDDRKKCEAKWERYEQATKEAIMKHTTEYVTKGRGAEYKYRRSPMTYLNGENWNDDGLLLARDGNTTMTDEQQFDYLTQRAAAAFDRQLDQEQP